MSRRITESEIKRITNLVINESNYDLEMVHGVSYNKQTELVDDVINRIKEHGNEYMMELNKLNYNFPVKKSIIAFSSLSFEKNLSVILKE